MKQIKVGKKYVSRCGRYVFKVVGVTGYGELLHTECCKILNKAAGGVTWSIGEKTSHYTAGNWRLSGSASKPDLVKRYRKAKPPVEPVHQGSKARLGVKITQKDVGRKVLLRNGEQGKITLAEGRCVFYEHGGSTRSASVYGSWTLATAANYNNIHSYDIVGFVKGDN